VRDEGLDQFAARVFQGFSSAEVGGVRFNESRIEVVQSDQKAELVAEPTRIAIGAI
jgi:hypothetical protein